MHNPRKVIQIAVSSDEVMGPQILALCKDGTVWFTYTAEGPTWDWTRLPPIPDESVKTSPAGSGPNPGRAR